MNPLDVARILQQAGFSGAGLVNALAIAWAESSLSPNAHNTKGEDSRGLFQINVLAHPEFANLNLYDPLTNAKVAYQLSGGGTDFSPWTTFTAGVYKNYLGIASSVVSGLVGGKAAYSESSTKDQPPISLPKVNVPVVSDVIGGLSAIAQAIAGGSNAIASGVSNAIKFVRWLGQPNLYLRIVFVVVGILLLLVGLIIFALSFVLSPDVRSAVRRVGPIQSVAKVVE